jgi:hypothetical protein
MDAHFGFHDYMTALRSGVAAVVHGEFTAFGLMGLVGLLRRPGRALLGLAAITVVYSTGRFVVFPLAEGRYFGLFFAAMGILLTSSLVSSRGTSPTPAALDVDT